MKLFDEFVRDNGFAVESDTGYGTYSDMHMVLKQEADVLSAYLYLCLPAPGKKERRALEEAIKEKGERFSAAVGVSSHPSFLRIDFRYDESVYKPVERFLNECDILLRPYGREMGIICAFCKKELDDKKPVYKREGDMIVPVCSDCSSFESGEKVKRNANRQDFNRKRARRSAVGFGLGFLLCFGIHTLLSYSAGFYSYIVAMSCPFLLRYMFERFGGSFRRFNDNQMIALLSAVCVIALLIGSAFGAAIRMSEYAENYENSTQQFVYDEYTEESTQGEAAAEFDRFIDMTFGTGAFRLTTPLGQLASLQLYTDNIIPAFLTVVGAVFCVKRGFRR